MFVVLHEFLVYGINTFVFVYICREFFYALVYKFQADGFMKENETGIVIALSAVVQVLI